MTCFITWAIYFETPFFRYLSMCPVRKACKTTFVSASSWLNVNKSWSFCSAIWNVFLPFVKLIGTLIISRKHLQARYFLNRRISACLFYCFERKISDHSPEAFFDVNSLNKHVLLFLLCYLLHYFWSLLFGKKLYFFSLPSWCLLLHSKM